MDTPKSFEQEGLIFERETTPTSIKFEKKGTFLPEFYSDRTFITNSAEDHKQNQEHFLNQTKGFLEELCYVSAVMKRLDHKISELRSQISDLESSEPASTQSKESENSYLTETSRSLLQKCADIGILKPQQESCLISFSAIPETLSSSAVITSAPTKPPSIFDLAEAAPSSIGPSLKVDKLPIVGLSKMYFGETKQNPSVA